MKIRRETVHEGTPAGTRNYTKASLSREPWALHTLSLCTWGDMTPVGDSGQLQAEWPGTFTETRMVQHTKIRYKSKSHKCLEWCLGTNTVTGFCLISYWFILSGHYIKVKMTKEKNTEQSKKKKKSNFLDLHMLFLSFNSNPEAHRVRSLQRVEWLISNNLKYHFWQFNTVSQFMAPSIKNVGPVFFWKVVHG